MKKVMNVSGSITNMSMEEANFSLFTTSTTEDPEIVVNSESQWVPLDTFIGLILAFSSCFFIGISVIYKKLALKDIEAQGGTRAVDGGYGYLKLPKWWLGITLMGLGELTNFVAYIFAPAILVTPLGVFSIVCTAALSPYFLKERLAMLGKLGCVLVLVGCVVVTLCGPKDREIATMEELQSQLLHAGFLTYAGLVVVISAIFMALVPRYGHRYVLLYITICSSFGSLSVMFCKGVGLALKQTIGGHNEFTNWATWVCLVALIACLLIETIYMQRALDLFNSSVFMSINYVLFTSLVIVASSILYTELREIGWKNIILTLLGFIVNIVALFLLHLDKGENNTNETADEETPDEAQQPMKSPAGALEQDSPLLGRAPGSPLSGLNLPHTMFPTKTNSCKSLISQTSLPLHATEDNEHAPHSENQDNDSHHSKSSRGSSSSNSSHSSSNSSSSGAEHSSSGRSGSQKEHRHDKACEVSRTHCRSLSGCMCEVPLLTELHTSNSKLSVHSGSKTNGLKTSHNNNRSRSSSCSSKHGDVDIHMEDVSEDTDFNHRQTAIA
ncbi:Magnesium transporter NIPA3 [Halocaridina rubra]|uniref:Magnesium transporter NIPA3 n=1 Tax=Halocaridina rubra TaxID=373956 RepID=A0AAN8XGN9_HALRR